MQILLYITISQTFHSIKQVQRHFDEGCILNLVSLPLPQFMVRGDAHYALCLETLKQFCPALLSILVNVDLQNEIKNTMDIPKLYNGCVLQGLHDPHTQCVHIYIYIYIYMCTYIYIYIYIYIYVTCHTKTRPSAQKMKMEL